MTVHKITPRRRAPKPGKMVFTVLKLAFLIAVCLFLVFPSLTIVSNSFKNRAELNRKEPTLIPETIITDSYKELFSDQEFVTGLLNSLKLALMSMALITCVAVPSAYAIARTKSKGASALQVWILVSQMVPGIILVVPLYNILKSIGLTNTHGGLLLVYLVSGQAVSIWTMSGFVASVPREIEEAGFIDGCNLLSMFWRILVPTILPGIATTMIMAFLSVWNEFFFALCLVKDPQLRTLPIKLRTYIGVSGQARVGMLSAASTLATIPGLIIFLFFQKYYVQGATAGAIK